MASTHVIISQRNATDIIPQRAVTYTAGMSLIFITPNIANTTMDVIDTGDKIDDIVSIKLSASNALRCFNAMLTMYMSSTPREHTIRAESGVSKKVATKVTSRLSFHYYQHT